MAPVRKVLPDTERGPARHPWKPKEVGRNNIHDFRAWSEKETTGMNTNGTINGRTWGWNEAAVYIGCTPGTLRQWVARRRVPHVKAGRLVRFRQQDLDNWLDQNAVKVEA